MILCNYKLLAFFAKSLNQPLKDPIQSRILWIVILKSFVYSVYIMETSSLWAEFVNKNRCISVRLGSEEDKSIEF